MTVNAGGGGTPGTPGTGLLATYFNNLDLTGTSVVQTDAQINFLWDNKTIPTAGIALNTYSVKWEGFLTALQTGAYTLNAKGDERIRLSVGGVLLINGWLDAGVWTDHRSVVNLTANTPVAVMIEYFNNEGAGGARFLWSGPGVGGNEVIIAQTYLRPKSGGGTPPPVTAAPVITTQPANVSVTVGSTATFSVAATGTPAPTYQWKKGGVNISGATNATYATLATVLGDNGAVFTVVATNSSGNATSTVATLTVTTVAPPGVVAPVITTQPSNVSVTVGQTVTFSVVASGTATLTYQWKRNGANISGATAASYTTLATVISDNGATFTVVVSNSAGLATSNAANLTVNAVATTPGTGTGLSGSYYNNMTLTAPSVLTRTDATLNFNWGGSPGTGVNADGFSVRWTGKVQAPITGTYTFFTTSDDGIRLWVNGTQLINNWTDHGPVEDSGSIALVAGSSYDIRVEYYENRGGATAKLSWSCAGLAKQVVPQDRLYNSAAPTVDFPLNPLNSLAIGTSTLGSYTDNGSSITIAGSGSDIWNSSDGFQCNRSVSVLCTPSIPCVRWPHDRTDSQLFFNSTLPASC